MALDREQVGLLFKLRADSSDAQRALTQFRGVVQSTVNDVRSRTDGLANSFLNVSQNLSGGLSGLTAGLTGVAGVAGVAGAALGSLALQVANYAGEIADLSAKTNLSTNTLQSLKLAATLTGQSFESVSETAVIFQRRIEEARSGNDQLKRTFDALHIDLSGPVDQAFRQTLERLSTVEDGAQKTAAAVDLFGRSGANLLPIMQQVGGSFQALEDRARELGIVLDEEAIKRADEFGDQIDLLKLQLGGLANQIGSVVIPVFSSFTQSLSATITIFKRVGEASEDTFTKIQRLLFILKSFSNLTTIPQGVAAILGSPGFLDQKTAEPPSTPPVELPRGGRTGGAGRATRPETVRLPVQDFSNIVEQYFRQLGRLEEEQIKRLEQARERSARVMEDILREQQDREIESIRAQVDQRVITEEEGALGIAAVRVAAFARTEDQLVERIKDLDEQVTRASAEAAARPFDTILQRRAQALQAERDLVRQQLTLLQEERTSIEELGNQAIAAARDRDLQDLLDYANEQKKIYQDLEETRKKAQMVDSVASGIFGTTFTDALRRTGSELAAFQALFANFTSQTKDQLAELPSLADTAFGAMTQGAIAMAEAFVLTGQTGPAAMRQLAAGVLAAIAKMAAQKAILNLALGIENLALAIMGVPNAGAAAVKHFIAAGIYGGIAVATGAAARAIAPAGGGGDTGGGGGGSSSRDRRIIEQGDRQRPEPQIIISRAETEPGVVVRKIVEDYRGNGTTRQVLRRDMLGDGG